MTLNDKTIIDLLDFAKENGFELEIDSETPGEFAKTIYLNSTHTVDEIITEIRLQLHVSESVTGEIPSIAGLVKGIYDNRELNS